MNLDLLLETAMARAGIEDRDRATRASEAVVEVLAECLPGGDAADLAEALPAPLAAAARRARQHRPVDVAELFQRVSSAEEVRYGLAIEHGEAVCEALGQHLDPELRARLQRHLAAEWAALFEPRTNSSPEPSPDDADAWHGTPPGQGHTLASGRPGSRHPLSEAAPPAAQSGSVVASSNPHADRKLSTATAAPAADLATGRPGSEESLADARDERKDR
jgi:uncharacterized protein (DUF2267 family)